jgi:uncharacterized protein YceH (UPF0502 family)
MEETPQEKPAPSPRWVPLAALDRRVLGVLMEKAKTVPESYPMSLNGIVTGCNQKSNRHPLMEIEPDDVEESLDRLRQLKAVGMVEGHGRVTKYRHYFYDWLGVDKVEAAVMTELLLRGTQTEGDLRSRAARMEPIPDLTTLRPVLASLKTKGLVISVTPEGRGHVVTHALFTPNELARIKSEHGGAAAIPAAVPGPDAAPAPARPASPGGPLPAPVSSEEVEDLRRQLEELRGQVAQLRGELDLLSTAHQQTHTDLHRLRDQLGA